jgi:hypothetical protein
LGYNDTSLSSFVFLQGMMIAGNETTFNQKKERMNVPSLHVFWGRQESNPGS